MSRRYVDFEPHPPGVPFAVQPRAVWLPGGTDLFDRFSHAHIRWRAINQRSLAKVVSSVEDVVGPAEG
jgi:hypothetical protein